MIIITGLFAIVETGTTHILPPLRNIRFRSTFRNASLRVDPHPSVTMWTVDEPSKQSRKLRLRVPFPTAPLVKKRLCPLPSFNSYECWHVVPMPLLLVFLPLHGTGDMGSRVNR